MQVSAVKAGRKKAVGIEIPLPKVPLILVIAKKGFVMCGYLNVDAAARLGDAAAVVKGVKTVGDLLRRPVVAVTPKAFALGVRVGMSGRQALSKLL